MDTAATDKNQGSPVPIYPEGKGLDEPMEPPALATEGLPEGHEPEPPEPEPEPSDQGARKKRTSKKRGYKKS